MRPSGCTITSSSWFRPWCGNSAPTCASVSSTTSRSPATRIFAQLPWRRRIVEGLVGADLLGFQRHGDAANFLRACRRTAGLTTSGTRIRLPAAAPGDASAGDGPPDGPPGGGPPGRREVRVGAFPVSIDFAAFEELACRPSVQVRAREIRQSLGDPGIVLLGIDRLDYTKGIIHRLKAYGELLGEGRLAPSDATLILVASPSRERVEHYRLLRDEVEVTVGRINGEHAELGNPPIHYLHQTYPREEMAALYLAADVMLVTSLRDGMNLVAKEYVACRHDETGALVLSEFAGAADELTSAILVNPHDIRGLKDAIVHAARISPNEARRRMRAMRRRVREHDVTHWATVFVERPDEGHRAQHPRGLARHVLADPAGRLPGMPVLDPLPFGRGTGRRHPHARRSFLPAHPGGQVGGSRGDQDGAGRRGKQREGDVAAGVAAPHDEPVLVVIPEPGGCHPAGILVIRA